MSAAPLGGRLALVTGASRGIGLAVAEALGAAGAHVVRLARSLRDASAQGRTDVQCDVGDARQVDAAVRLVLERHGAPDIVVNNAGGFFVKSIAETGADEFAQTLAVNLTAAFLVVRAVVPEMVRRGRGHVVTIGSTSDHVAYPGGAAYTASKYGLRGLHEVLRAELAGSGVRATLVSPGPVNTDVWDPIDPDNTPGFTKRADMMLPADVAEAVLFAVTRPERVDVTELRLMPTGRRP